jgi:hypothetical protein
MYRRHAPVVLAGDLLQVLGGHPDIDPAPGDVLAGEPGDTTLPLTVLVPLPGDQEDMPAGSRATRLSQRKVSETVGRQRHATVVPDESVAGSNAGRHWMTAVDSLQPPSHRRGHAAHPQGPRYWETFQEIIQDLLVLPLRTGRSTGCVAF